MSDVNIVCVSGTVSDAPSLVQFETASKASVTLESRRGFTGKDGTEREFKTFVECIFWDKASIEILNNVAEGTKLLVQGQLSFDKWEKDGEERSKLLVRGVYVEVIGGDNPQPRQTQQARPADKPPTAKPKYTGKPQTKPQRPAQPAPTEEAKGDDDIPF